MDYVKILQAKWLIRPALISILSSMKRVSVFLLPPGWDAGPSQGYPQPSKFTRYPIIYLGGERHSVLPKNTTQCPRPGLEPGQLYPETSASMVKF